jgi:hypothetical protein
MSQLHATQNVIKNKGSSQLELHAICNYEKSYEIIYETPPLAIRRTKHGKHPMSKRRVGAKMMGS